MARYELFVGQPPFYTNSVYALIRHIVKVGLLTACFQIFALCFFNFFLIYALSALWQDPVKYPDNMSANFKSFLKGLLNKVLN
jgi:fused-like protein